MQATKAIAIVIFLFTTVNPAHSQLKSINNSIKHELQEVIRDYPNQFKNIRGELLSQNPQSTDYISRVSIKNAEQCFVTTYTSSGKAVYSWQARMNSTENFEDAVKLYKSIYQQLNGLNISIDGTRLSFQGVYDSPKESMKYTATFFKPETADLSLRKLVIELQTVFEFPEWRVNVLVYAKEKEDDEPGAAIEE